MADVRPSEGRTLYCSLCKEDLIFVDAGECKVLRVRRATKCRFYKSWLKVMGSPICKSIGTDEKDVLGAFPQRTRLVPAPSGPESKPLQGGSEK